MYSQLKKFLGRSRTMRWAASSIYYLVLRLLHFMTKAGLMSRTAKFPSIHYPRHAILTWGNRELEAARHHNAIAAYNVAMEQNPQDILTRVQIGVAHFLAGEYSAAERNFALIESLKASEQDRWDVADLPVRILDGSWLLAIGHVAAIDTYVKAMALNWLPQIRTILAYDIRTPPTGWRLLPYWSKFIEVVKATTESGAALEHVIFHNQISDADNESLDPGDVNIRDRSKPKLGVHEQNLRRVALMQSFWAGSDNEGRTRWYAPWGAAVQHAWKAQNRQPLLAPSKEEESRFRMIMEQSFGLPRDAWFVLLHVREPGFHLRWHLKHEGTRNADIATYQSVIDYIVSRGGYVVRGGDPTMTPLRPQRNVIDYALSSFRSPELDIMLCATCRFFVGTNSGFSLVPPIFGKRCVLTNWSPIAIPNWYPDDIFIPKLVKNRKTGALLSFEAMFGSVAGWSQFARDFVKDYKILDNDPVDILDAVQELCEEEDGIRQLSAEDYARIERFNHIAVEKESYVGSRIGSRFLKKYERLL